MLTPEDLDQVVRDKLAATIVEQLTSEEITAILTSELAELLKNWSFKNQLRDALAERVEKKAGKLVKTEEWETRISAAIADGFDQFLEQLPAALSRTFTDMFIGDQAAMHKNSRLGYHLTQLMMQKANH